MPSSKTKLPLLASTGLAAVISFIPMASLGGGSYFSRVHYSGETVDAATARNRGKDGPLGVQAGITSTTAVFDMSISIAENPSGDNDSTADPGASDDEQNAYETVFKHFADAVCEQTNGAHKLGKLTVFREGKQSSNVDIVWGKTGRPNANPTGFGKAGWQIRMFDTFGDIKVSDGGTDLQLLGYIAGHEWGHYVLGVYDEYAEAGSNPPKDPYIPLKDDDPVDKAIMNRGRSAVSSGDFKWLNHSTSNNIGDVTQTAQGRVYGKSGWDTLIQTTNNDPTTIGAFNVPKRTHYSNLVGKQPTATDNWYKVELPTGRTGCRDKLNIQWVDSLELDIVLDRSGSMGGPGITNAKSAASALVDLLTENETAAGVSSFSSTVSSNAAITPITGAADKTTLKNAIANIRTTGLTAMYDGAVFGLNKLQTYATTNNTNAQQLVFLLTDGGDNSSSETLASTTAKFVAAGVPVIGFGYGSASDPNLPALASATGGKFFFSPTNVTDIQNAFSQAFAQASGSSALSSSSVGVTAGSTSDEPFVIDDTVDELSLLFTYQGASTAYTLTVLDASDVDTGLSFTCTDNAGIASCVLNLDSAAVAALGTGAYKVRAENGSATDITYSLNIVATTAVGSDGGNYSVGVASQGGSTISYPDPIVISVVVSKVLPITGVSVVATVTDPNGTVTTIDLNDTGVGADLTADDGLYSAWAPYTIDGTYDVRVTVTNPSGSASYSTVALSEAGLDPGQTVSNPTLGAQNFQRFGSTQVSVQGVVPDDHTNDPTNSAACTALTTDNTGVAGRCDAAGDMDCFAIAGPVATTSAIVVRTFNNALGAEPKFTVYASDGTTVIASADPATATPSNGALYTSIAPSDIDAAGMVVVVEDVDASHSGGSYSVGAGAKLASDVPANTGGGGSTGSGGATGPLGLLMFALLGLVGIYRRRRA
jgi:uncharacterized protein YegL